MHKFNKRATERIKLTSSKEEAEFEEKQKKERK